MLLDHRTYTVRPGSMAKQMALYEEYGLKAQKRHLGEPVAYLITESGEVNTYVHIWVYQDAADRATRRAADGLCLSFEIACQEHAKLTCRQIGAVTSHQLYDGGAQDAGQTIADFVGYHIPNLS